MKQIELFFRKVVNRNLWMRSVFFRIKFILGKSVYKEYCDSTSSLFVHIPKAAGKSVSQSLFGCDKPGHYYALDYQRESLGKFESYFKFSFVREPVERLKSAYFFLCEGGTTEGDKEIGALLRKETESFEDFVLNWLDEEKMYSWFHFIPQADFLLVDGELAVDFVGRFENIESDFDEVAKRLGKKVRLKKINKTKSSKDFEVSGAVKVRVKELYRQDYQLFGYE